MEEQKHPWWSRLLCRIGMHAWRDGPGYPCTVCGTPDTFWEGK